MSPYNTSAPGSTVKTVPKVQKLNTRQAAFIKEYTVFAIESGIEDCLVCNFWTFRQVFHSNQSCT